ncbi:MAG: TDT family transporter [Candidatus Niameybacter stercoravium]|nr:TDT family transporter [Candidatus Niameybacter stercoravium]
MPQKSLKAKLANLPVPILPTLVGTATLSNMWLPLGFTWIRHLTMWACAIVMLCYVGKMIFHFKTVKAEYSNTVPASLYAGFTMITMILGSYVFDFNPVIGKAMWALGLWLHAIHLIVFIYRNVIKGFNKDTFVPSWFVTFNGIMVSTVVGVPMNEPAIGKFIVYYGLVALVILLPLMVVRLIKCPITTGPLFMTKAIMLAPTSLCLVSYLNFITKPNVWMVYGLYAIIFVSLLYVVINLPKFFSFTFHPGFASLTFPMAIGIVASNKMSAFLINAGNEALGNAVKQIAGLQLYVTTAIVAFVVFNFFMMLVKSFKTNEAA